MGGFLVIICLHLSGIGDGMGRVARAVPRGVILDRKKRKMAGPSFWGCFLPFGNLLRRPSLDKRQNTWNILAYIFRVPRCWERAGEIRLGLLEQGGLGQPDGCSVPFVGTSCGWSLAWSWEPDNSALMNLYDCKILKGVALLISCPRLGGGVCKLLLEMPLLRLISFSPLESCF